MALPAQLLKVRIAGGTPTAAEANRIQDNVGTLLNEVAAVPILQGNAVKGLEFGTGGSPALTRNISHGLGRAWVGWLITDQDQPANVWRSSTDNRDKFLTLTVDSTVTLDVLVW